MAGKAKEKKNKEVAVIPPTAPAVAPKKALVHEGEPEEQLAFAMKAANALMKAVKQKPKPVLIRGEQYLEYGDWQTLARFFGATAAIEWSTKLVDEKTGAFVGYEARAQVLHNGVVISSAEAMCMKAEKNWRDRDEFMLRSMAQTRAAAKALRNAYGWVAELAGMKATPAEEMDGVGGYDTSPIKADAVPVISYDDHEGVDIHDPRFMRPGTIVTTTVPPTETPKTKLAAILRHHGVDYRDRKAAEQFIADRTQLALVDGNLVEIIRMLEEQDKQ